MIKQMYSTSYTVEDRQSSDYSATLEECKQFIRERQSTLRGLEGIEFVNEVKKIINDYIQEKRPVVSGYLIGDTVNIERLSIKLNEDINEFGIITAALSNPELTDIYCFGTGPGNTFVMKGNKSEVLRDSNNNVLYYKTSEEIEAVINQLAFSSSLRLSTSCPILYAQTLHGHRLTANDSIASAPRTLPNGEKVKEPTFSIRMGSKKELTLNEMIYTLKTIHPNIARALILFQKLKSMKILYSGVPGTGKTTLMTEILRTLNDKTIYTLERTAEINLAKYDENGVQINKVKSLVALADDIQDVKDTSVATLYNLYLLTLREKLDILVLGEMRALKEILVMLEAGVAGQGVSGTIHGEDDETTAERLIKDVCQLKNASRSEAMEEVYLSLDLIISMELSDIDGKIRVRSISEIIKTDTALGPRLGFNKLYEFHRTKRGINPETGSVYGHYRKIGVPKGKLLRKIQESDITDDDEAFLLEPASIEEPIDFEGTW